MGLPVGQSFYNPLDDKLARPAGAYEGQGGSLGGSSFVRNYRRMVAANQGATQQLSQRLSTHLNDYGAQLEANKDRLDVSERDRARAFFDLPFTQGGRETLLAGTVGAAARSGYSNPQAKLDAYLLGQQGMQPLNQQRAKWDTLMNKLAEPSPAPAPPPGPGGGPQLPEIPEIDWSKFFPDWSKIFPWLGQPPSTPPPGGQQPPPTQPPPMQPPPTQQPPAGGSQYGTVNGLPTWLRVDRNGFLHNMNATDPSKVWKPPPGYKLALGSDFPQWLTVNYATGSLHNKNSDDPSKPWVPGAEFFGGAPYVPPSSPPSSPPPATPPSNRDPSAPLVNGKPAWGPGANHYSSSGAMLPPDGHTGGIPWSNFNGERGVFVPGYGFFVGGLPPALNVLWSGTPGSSPIAGLYLTNLGPSSGKWNMPSGFNADWFRRGVSGTPATTPPNAYRPAPAPSRPALGNAILRTSTSPSPTGTSILRSATNVQPVYTNVFSALRGFSW